MMDTGNFKEVFTSDETKRLRTELDAAQERIAELEGTPKVEHDGEFKTWWELALHVGAWKNHEIDYVHFGSEMAVRAFAIHLLRQRDEFERQQGEQLAALQALLQKKDEALRDFSIAWEYGRDPAQSSIDALSITSPQDTLAPYLRCVKAMKDLLEAMHSEGGEQGSWFRKPATREHQAKEYVAWQEFHAALEGIK